MLAGVAHRASSTAYSGFRGASILNLVRVGQGELLIGNSAQSYSTRLLSSSNQFSLARPFSRKPINVAADGLLQKASMRLRAPVGCNPNFGLFLGSRSKNYHPLSSVYYSTGAAQDVSIDGNSRDENKILKLSSGSCYFPHPDKEATGGEDAHFISEDEQTIGLADGVGSWVHLGVNAGLFSRELMSNSVNAIEKEPKGSIDPARVLEKAHAGTKAKGSSTAVIITLTDKGLHAINLGDSGFMVIRDGHITFQSPVQRHGVNFTYQLESGKWADPPSSGEIFTIPVEKGDAIVAGTGGLFHNLFNNEITAVVVHAVQAGFDPQVTAQKIAALARQRALDKTCQTPFSTAAQECGYRTYYGGKPDDITVVVSYVTNSTTTV